VKLDVRLQPSTSMSNQRRTPIRVALPLLLSAAAVLAATSASAQVNAPAVKASPIRASAPFSTHTRRPTISTARPTLSRAEARTFQSESRESQVEAGHQGRPSLASLARSSTTAPVKPQTAPMKLSPPVKTRSHQ
jgi:hypothetical protein